MASFQNIVSLFIGGQNNECFNSFIDLDQYNREHFINALYDKSFYDVASHEDCLNLSRFLLLKINENIFNL